MSCVSLHRLTVTLVAVITLGAAPVPAQTVADLRYAIATPVELTYSAVELRSVTDFARPDSSATFETRITYRLQLEPLDDDIVAGLSVIERTIDGTRTQPPEPIDQTITARGPRPDPTDERALDALLTTGPLLYLPGRALIAGESWTDTLSFMTQRDSSILKVRSIVTGTYERDTLINGRRVNVVRFRTAEIMVTERPGPAMTLITSTSGGREELVLWDPLRHVLLLRESDRQLSHEIETVSGPRTVIERSRTVLRLVE